MKFSSVIAGVIGVVGLLFILSVLFSLPVMWLWNATLPELFNCKIIDLWMAWKISLLSAFLFKGSSISTGSK